MPERLTKRQEECLRLSATMTDKEIARALGISENTVDKHFREILRKFGVSTRKAALRALASDASYATDAIPPGPVSAPDQGVDADRVAGSLASTAPAAEGLYGLYTRLGRWRTPGSLRVRTMAIFGWALAGLLVLTVLTGLVGLVFGGTDSFAPTGGNP
ncbi:helix-turn-helix transcriptional regulator [Brevundimonas sp. M20]|jgi:DNA-binding CsgD family transcriptional regulator|uniref:helix-turn-helix domain-containing protein n=1 Tax=Brevundimonas sp. M20 TaxID=2591463 RepID=UPI00114676BE|nr:helix-turn-helix transcriptional regulator [Brevundimonas sp. M20]QDH72082.1 helix-turn-helix transcriptional regulator [Brevundimonas sp. M20]